MVKKLGEGALPFTLKFAAASPNSVLIQGEKEDKTPMGVFYKIRVWIGDDTGDLEGVPNSTINMTILKSQVNLNLNLEEKLKFAFS